MNWVIPCRARRATPLATSSGGDVAHLMPADHLGALDETAERAGQRRRPLDGAMGHAGAQADTAIALDPGEPRDTMEAHDVARRDPPAPDLDDQVGAPGEEARLRTETRGEGDRVVETLGLVVLEAAHEVSASSSSASAYPAEQTRSSSFPGALIEMMVQTLRGATVTSAPIPPAKR